MLKLEHISFTADDKEILKDINLTLDDHFIAITGPNGSGKSTLLKVIMGIITPDTGRILLDGEDITDLSITERSRKGISFAFQQPVRFKGLRVRDLLELAAGRKKGKEGTEAFYQACRTLNAVGLDAKEYIGRELNDTLSGGEMKRIEIAMAAARGTALTLFDEPEAGIDLWSFQSLIQVFEKLYQQTSGTIMIISHQERILNIADKIIYLKDGEVLEYDEGRKVMQHLAEDIQPVPDMGAAAQ
ncbi:MAG: ATP-binding cassette domain-containing protein [Lachnospiraceae bacterium]|nr:ATP-binding cassette domain-containing protein [Lachnospiraceae bacterium]